MEVMAIQCYTLVLVKSERIERLKADMLGRMMMMLLVCNKDILKIQRPFVFPEVRRIT